MNGFLTVGRKKNDEVEDELDRSLEGMDHSDDQFDKGTDLRHHAATDCELPFVESRFVELFDSYSSQFKGHFLMLWLFSDIFFLPQSAKGQIFDIFVFQAFPIT